MSSIILAFTSNTVQALSTLRGWARGVIVEVARRSMAAVDRLLALGVTPGAKVTVFETFPGIVFLWDQTELAIECHVADAVLVRPEETRS
jgi:Fe2+ transport system protein FeoA